MSSRLLRSAASAWLLLLVIMFTNGIVRVAVLQPRLAEEPARRLATLVGVALVVAFAYAYVRRTPFRTGHELLLVGVVWLALTLAFELGMGLATGRSRGEMLADYDLTRGRLWPLVLVATLLAPWAWSRRARP
jgi:hypothetical protein